MSKFKIVIQCLLCFLVIPSNGSIANEQPIQVVTEYLDPYQVRNDDGSLGGYTVEVVQRLFELTHDTPNISVLPWARAYRTALTKPNVMIFSIARNQSRETLFQWIGIIKPRKTYFWGLASKFNEEFTSIEQAKSCRISVSKNYNSAIFLQEQNFPHLFFTTRHQQNVGMLLKGRADIILSSEFELLKIIKAQSYVFSDFKKMKEIEELNGGLSIAFSNGSDAQLVARFKKAFKEIENNGELDNIKKKWGITDE